MPSISVKEGTIHFDVIGEGMPIIVLHPLGTDHRSMINWLEPVFEKYIRLN